MLTLNHKYKFLFCIVPLFMILNIFTFSQPLSPTLTTNVLYNSGNISTETTFILYDVKSQMHEYHPDEFHILQFLKISSKIPDLKILKDIKFSGALGKKDLFKCLDGNINFASGAAFEFNDNPLNSSYINWIKFGYGKGLLLKGNYPNINFMMKEYDSLIKNKQLDYILDDPNFIVGYTSIGFSSIKFYDSLVKNRQSQYYGIQSIIGSKMKYILGNFIISNENESKLLLGNKLLFELTSKIDLSYKLYRNVYLRYFYDHLLLNFFAEYSKYYNENISNKYFKFGIGLTFKRRTGGNYRIFHNEEDTEY